jgi:large subunit ribosomal protein L20
MRALWLIRTNAALRDNGTSWSKFAGKLKKDSVKLNRRMLSELAVQYPEVFDRMVKNLS